MTRNTIFIGHATPEDNEFTLWLQSKLINEGYKGECDLTFLLGGEADYWKNLQDFLTNQTAKYILVVSKDTFTKQGVLDEWEHCRSLERQFGLPDFIIPIKIDNSPYNSRIGLNRRNIISFEEFWGTGLKRLLKKLSNDNVFRTESNKLSINDWYENVYTNWSGIQKDETDTFFSNWLQIPSLPTKVNFYKFYNEDQAKAVLQNNLVFPAIRHGNFIITFQRSLDFYLSDKQFEIEPLEKFTKESASAFEYYEGDEFPMYHDFRRLLVRLLKECFERYLINLGLKTYELSNKTRCFYFEYNELNKAKGKFFIHDKHKNIGVTGKYYDSFWHFAISFHALLHPELCFSLKSHIIFSDDGKIGWTDKRKMHIARRNKGKTMRNKEWRDQLLAFLSCLKEEETHNIEIEINRDEVLTLPSTTLLFKARFSYIEPNDESRLQSIDSFIDEEDYYDNINEQETNV